MLSTGATAVSSDYSSRPRINDQVKEFFYEKINTNSLLPRTDQAPITFVIPSIEGIFIDPKQIFLNLKLQLHKKIDGAWADLPANEPVLENVAPYNFFFYTLFDELEIEFNNELIESTKFNYQLQTYLKLLLNTNSAMRESILANTLSYPDKAGTFNLVSGANATLNPGAYARLKKLDKSSILEMRGQVLSDILEVSRPIIDGVSVTLRFFPSPPEKCLIHTKNAAADPTPSYRIEILSAELYVGRIKPKIKNIQSAVYPFIKRKIQRHIHPKAIQEFGPVTIASGILPQRCFVVAVTEQEFLGTLLSHRLKFSHHKLSHISVIKNGEMFPFREGYNPDFTLKQYSDCYFALLHERGGEANTFDIPFNYDEYDSGYTIYVWDLTNNHSIMAPENQYSEPTAGGLLQLKAHFSTAPTENLCLYVILEYDSAYTIRKDRTTEIDEKPQKTSKK